jgi:quercetin dioxygenase-like cupin family protein
MNAEEIPRIHSAQVVVGCTNLADTLAILTSQLGFRVDVIFPADAPSTAVVSGYGVALRLEETAVEGVTPVTLRLACDASELDRLRAATLSDDSHGLRIIWTDRAPTMAVPTGTQEFIITRTADANAWGTGRAGMQYRDLIPGRLGGRFVTSHIRIQSGGPVPDYVHFHNIRFQMIFCKAGWVRVVYEDQGPPFVLNAGDCVLQPPGIRHRVLESSAGLEVIELGCPAIHETLADHALPLPNQTIDPARQFGGQRFVRHIAAETPPQPWEWNGASTPGFSALDTGIGAATGGLAHARVVLAGGGNATTATAHTGELLFLFVLEGTLELTSASLGVHALDAGDSVVLPAGITFALSANATSGSALRMLEVRLPA